MRGLAVVYLAILITLIGCAISWMWSGSLGLAAGCLAGGFALWFWVIQRIAEGQSIKSYRAPPEKEEHLVAWFYATRMTREEKQQLLIGFLVYMLALFVVLAIRVHPPPFLQPIPPEALAVFHYFLCGVCIPASFIREA